MRQKSLHDRRVNRDIRIGDQVWRVNRTIKNQSKTRLGSYEIVDFMRHNVYKLRLCLW